MELILWWKFEDEFAYFTMIISIWRFTTGAADLYCFLNVFAMLMVSLLDSLYVFFHIKLVLFGTDLVISWNKFSGPVLRYRQTSFCAIAWLDLWQSGTRSEALGPKYFGIIYMASIIYLFSFIRVSVSYIWHHIIYLFFLYRGIKDKPFLLILPHQVLGR
jgi:hypothetical protein